MSPKPTPFNVRLRSEETGGHASLIEVIPEVYGSGLGSARKPEEPQR
jgi:hypothetical protein